MPSSRTTQRACWILGMLNIVILLCVGVNQYCITQPDIIVEEFITNDGGKEAQLGKLQAGVYNLLIDYKTNMSNVYACVQTNEVQGFYADDFILNSGKDKLTTQIWLDKEIDDITVEIRVNSDEWGKEGSLLEVYAVSASRNTRGSCTYKMLRVAVFLIILDIVAIGIIMRKKLSGHTRTLIGLVIIIMVSSVGICGKGMLARDDTTFQWARVWGLANGIKNGDFPVRIQSEWANGYGYAVSVFYGDLFLYFPSILVLLKLPLYMACKVYVLMVNIGTVVLSYEAFKKISKNPSIGLLCSGVYSLSIYRMCNIYYRGAVGEYTAMMLLPVVVLGIWNILFENVEEEKYKRQWMILSLGMSGIILTHVLSCEMIALFLFMICIIAYKRIFNGKRFAELIKAVVGTIGLSAAFIVPFLDYAREDIKVFEERDVYGIQKYGISLRQLLGLGKLGKIPSQSEEVTIMAISVGVSVVLVLFIAGYLLIYERKTDNIGKIMIILCLGVIALWMATDCFPYDRLEQFYFAKMLIGSLQFPFRFMSLAMLLFALLLCLIAAELQGKMNRNVYCVIFGVMCIITIGQCLQYCQYVKEERGTMTKVDGAEWTGAALTMYGGQYLYQGTDYFAVMDDDSIGGWVKIEDYKRNGLEYEITCSSDIDTRMELPLFYYPDYQCWDVSTGEKFHVVKGDNNELWVDNIPAGYQGTLKVAFVEPVMWRIGEIVSLITLGIYGIYFYRNKSRDLNRYKNNR